LGDSSEQSFWRRSAQWRSSTGFHADRCPADRHCGCTWRDISGTDYISHPASNHDWSTDADHHQGSRGQYGERASAKRPRVNFADVWSKWSGDKSIHAAASMPDANRSTRNAERICRDRKCRQHAGCQRRFS